MPAIPVMTGPFFLIGHSQAASTSLLSSRAKFVHIPMGGNQFLPLLRTGQNHFFMKNACGDVAASKTILLGTRSFQLSPNSSCILDRVPFFSDFIFSDDLFLLSSD